MARNVKVELWEKFNMLTVVWEQYKKFRNCWTRRDTIVPCICDCWKKIDVTYVSLKRRMSCWCVVWKWWKHFCTNKPWFWNRHSMMYRCYNKACSTYKWYWLKWITVCEDWHNPALFWRDMWDSYEDWLTIDRIDSNWNYCKENCRRATMKQQNRNKSSNHIIKYKWESKPLTQRCEDLWLNPDTVSARINRSWWSVEDAFEKEIVSVPKNLYYSYDWIELPLMERVRMSWINSYTLRSRLEKMDIKSALNKPVKWRKLDLSFIDNLKKKKE